MTQGPRDRAGAGVAPGHVSSTVVAPLAGTVAPLSSVPDPVFAVGAVGDGVAVVPDPGGGAVAVRSPVAGVVRRVLPHLFIVDTAGGAHVLVHLGIDTGRLEGEGFTTVVAEGDRVAAGDPVTTYTPCEVARRGYDPAVVVVALRSGAGTVVPGALPGEPCAAGDALFTV